MAGGGAGAGPAQIYRIAVGTGLNRVPGVPSLERGWDKDVTIQAKVLAVGNLNMDLMARAPRLPRGGEALVGQSFTTIPGGRDTNQTVTVARLSAGVTMTGCLGDDVYGDQLYRTSRAEGINYQGVKRVVGEPSGAALIMADDNSQNIIVIAAGGDGYLSPAVLAHHEYLLEQVQVAICQLEGSLETVGHVPRRIHALGKTVALNPAPATRDVPAGRLPLVDYLVPNETESELLCCLPVDSLENVGRVAECLREMDAGRVIVTLGAQGALLVDGGRVEYFPVARVKMLDTMAVGDTFVGSFVAAPVRSLDEIAVIRFDQAAAAISVTRLGAQTLIPSCEEVERAPVGEAWEGRCRCYRWITPAVLSALRSQARTTPRLTYPLEG